MENNEKLEKGIGNKETAALSPGKVEILNVEIEPIKGYDKIKLTVKHPDKEEPIQISSAKYVKGDQIKETGLWYKLDEDKNLQKGSAVAELMTFVGVKTLRELIHKEVTTELDAKGYLTIKAY